MHNTNEQDTPFKPDEPMLVIWRVLNDPPSDLSQRSQLVAVIWNDGRIIREAVLEASQQAYIQGKVQTDDLATLKALCSSDKAKAHRQSGLTVDGVTIFLRYNHSNKVMTISEDLPLGSGTRINKVISYLFNDVQVIEKQDIELNSELLQNLRRY